MKLARKTLRPTVFFLGLTLCALPAKAGIVFDYSHDSFFASNMTAKLALEAAAADINSAITTVLSEITAAQDTITGTSGGATATFNWDWTYENPTTGTSETFDPVSIAAGDVKIFAGMRPLSGSTLGVGGPGGVGVSFGVSGPSGDWPGAVGDASSNSNTVYSRGGGPTITNFSGSFAGGTYNVDHGSTIGHLWFDNDTNNDTVIDDATTLASNWHFDHTTTTGLAGKSDFYSVALHEILHAIGFGTADSWDDKVSGTDWTGSEVIALVGSGTGLVDGGGGHIASGIMSTRVSDGVAQEVVMDPTLTVGTRKELTWLDLAFLRDIGWETQAVPEPSSWALMSLAIACTAGYRARQRRRRRKVESSAQNAA